MKKEIKFIHCSDIHLGANPFNIEKRFEEHLKDGGLGGGVGDGVPLFFATGQSDAVFFGEMISSILSNCQNEFAFIALFIIDEGVLELGKTLIVSGDRGGEYRGRALHVHAAHERWKHSEDDGGERKSDGQDVDDAFPFARSLNDGVVRNEGAKACLEAVGGLRGDSLFLFLLVFGHSSSIFLLKANKTIP